MIRAAYGLEPPPVGEAARLDLRAHEAVSGCATSSKAGRASAAGGPGAGRRGARARAGASARTREPGRVAVLDLCARAHAALAGRLPARARGGRLPAAGDRDAVPPGRDPARARERGPARRLVRPDPLARDRYLFYTACTRAWRRLTLVREAADRRRPAAGAEPLLGRGPLALRPGRGRALDAKRPLLEPAWELDRAPTERERLRAAARSRPPTRTRPARSRRANGWERRIERALARSPGRRRLTHPAVLAELARARALLGHRARDLPRRAPRCGSSTG